MIHVSNSNSSSSGSGAASAVVDLDHASAGMVLAEALLDGHGTVLLPPGAVLSDSSLASLRRRGVASCSVLVPPEAETAEQAAARRQLCLQRLQHLFRRSAATEATGELLRLLADYRSRS